MEFTFQLQVARERRGKYTNRYQMVPEENKSMYFREGPDGWIVPNTERRERQSRPFPDRKQPGQRAADGGGPAAFTDL